jgi:hypothetical protein
MHHFPLMELRSVTERRLASGLRHPVRTHGKYQHPEHWSFFGMPGRWYFLDVARLPYQPRAHIGQPCGPVSVQLLEDGLE